MGVLEQTTFKFKSTSMSWKKKKIARSFLLLSLRQEEMSLFGLYGFFTVAGNLLTFA